MTIESMQKTRRGLTLYDKNPYVENASLSTAEGARRRSLTSSDGTRLMITDGEKNLAPAGFWQYEEVDKTKFVKLYVSGVRAFRELSKAGATVFEILYTEVQKAIGRDRVYLSFAGISSDEFNLSQATFTRGMRELIDKKFVAPTASVGWYWVNPDYMWNGDRLAYVKEYRLKRDESSDAKYRDQLEARGQERLLP
jgi:hypothetical protein